VKTITSARWHYSISIPLDWSAAHSAGEDTYSSPGQGGPVLHVELVEMPLGNGPSVPLSVLAEEVAAVHSGDYGRSRPDGQSPTTVGGLHATELVWLHAKTRDGTTYASEVVVIHDRKGFDIARHAPLASGTTGEGQFLEIIGSLTWA